MANFLHKSYPDSAYISVNEISGVIDISPIDRDALKQEVFPFNVGSSATVLQALR